MKPTSLHYGSTYFFIKMKNLLTKMRLLKLKTNFNNKHINFNLCVYSKKQNLLFFITLITYQLSIAQTLVTNHHISWSATQGVKEYNGDYLQTDGKTIEYYSHELGGGATRRYGRYKFDHPEIKNSKIKKIVLQIKYSRTSPLNAPAIMKVSIPFIQCNNEISWGQLLSNDLGNLWSCVQTGKIIQSPSSESGFEEIKNFIIHDPNININNIHLLDPNSTYTTLCFTPWQGTIKISSAKLIIDYETDPDIVGNTICCNQSFIEKGNPSTIIGNSPSGGNGNYLYQWQQSTNGTSWSNISGATTKDFNPPILTSTRYYRRKITSGTASDSYSPATTILIEEYNNTICCDQNLTSGQVPYLIQGNPPASGNTYTFKWKESSNGATWKYISGENEQNLTPVSKGWSNYYCRETFLNGTSLGLSNSIHINHPNIQNNTICCDRNHAIPTDPIIIDAPTPIGGNEIFSFSWEKSDDGSNWTTIPGADTEDYDPLFSDKTTYYRRVIESSGMKNISNPVQIEIAYSNEICCNQELSNGDSPVKIDGTSPTSTTATFNHVWEASMDGLFWEVVHNQTGEDLTPPSSGWKRFYRRNVTINNGEYFSTSNTIEINTPDLFNNSICCEQEIYKDLGQTFSTLIGENPSGGFKDYSFQWETLVNGNWENIDWFEKDYLPVQMQDTGIYRRKVSSGDLTSYSNEVELRKSYIINLINTDDYESISPETEIKLDFTVKDGYSISDGIHLEIANSEDDFGENALVTPLSIDQFGRLSGTLPLETSYGEKLFRLYSNNGYKSNTVKVQIKESTILNLSMSSLTFNNNGIVSLNDQRFSVGENTMPVLFFTELKTPNLNNILIEKSILKLEHSTYNLTGQNLIEIKRITSHKDLNEISTLNPPETSNNDTTLFDANFFQGKFRQLDITDLFRNSCRSDGLYGFIMNAINENNGPAIFEGKSLCIQLTFKPKTNIDSHWEKTFDFKNAFHNHQWGDLDYLTGDFDGDGQDEILVSTIDLESGHSMVMYDFVSNEWTLKWIGSTGNDPIVDYRRKLQVGDIDGDGIDELVASGDWMPVFKYVNNNFQWIAGGHVSSSSGIYPYRNNFILGDFDGDQKAEIIGIDGWVTEFNFSGGIWNWGRSTYGNPTPITPYKDDEIRVGDFNGDGIDDALCLGGWATLFGFFTSTNGDFNSNILWSNEGEPSLGGWKYPLEDETALLTGNIDVVDNKEELMFIGNSWSTTIDFTSGPQSNIEWRWSNYGNPPFINDWPLNSKNNVDFLLIRVNPNEPKQLLAIDKTIEQYSMYRVVSGKNMRVVNSERKNKNIIHICPDVDLNQENVLDPSLSFDWSSLEEKNTECKNSYDRLENSFEIFAQPTLCIDGKINISTNKFNSTPMIQVSVISMDGKTLRSFNNNSRVDVSMSGLESGIYFLHISIDDEYLETKQIIYTPQ